MRILIPSLILFILMSNSCRDVEKSYSDSNYSMVSEGNDGDYSYVRNYVHRDDSRLTKKEIFLDSTFSTMLGKFFYQDSVLNGPYVIYNQGLPTQEGYYVNGALQGERKMFKKGKLVQTAHFRQGVKADIWTEYEESGKIIRTQRYDFKGVLLEEKEY